ncbi:hypothetical protein SS50377_23062 [Spironucleus salmonicida]|uniref:Uncharacterized protein n=1 Tax=Spironucleus salmonicida TaxID=348837 RepID=V6LTR3_9EUKA|nr:hypothetical protein SS50377_23062 [Spironucleus salmonicida]|eukprot:EST47638.1 Hypothetical protein SS50377_12333 [Spironucleus salmonicida]
MEFLLQLNEIPPKFFVQNENFAMFVDPFLNYQNQLKQLLEYPSESTENIIQAMTKIHPFLPVSQHQILFQNALNELSHKFQIQQNEQIEDDISMQRSGAASLEQIVQRYGSKSPLKSLNEADLGQTELYNEEIALLKENEILEKEVNAKIGQIHILKNKFLNKYQKYIIQVIAVVYLGYVIAAWNK